MASAQNPAIWIATQPAVYASGRKVSDAYISPFSGALWPEVQSRLGGMKIFSGSIYRLSDYGYSMDKTNGGFPYPAAAREVVEMLTDLTTANGSSLTSTGVTGGIPIQMESPVLPDGVLPNGARYTSYIEGFDGSFNGVIGYLSNSLKYAVRENLITNEQARSINIKYIAMDEPLYFGSIYKTPTNLVVDGVRIQSPQWSIAEVAEKAAKALLKAKQILGINDPGLRFGDIEPLPFVSAQQVDSWVQAFETAAVAIGLKGDATKLAFFQADVVWGVAGWQKNLQDVAAVLEARGVPLSIIINGRGSESTAVAWTDNALTALISVTNLPGLKYESLGIQNWHSAIPTPLFGAANRSNTPGTLVNTARYIPALEAVRELYAENVANALPNYYELFFSARNFATDRTNATDLSHALKAISTYKSTLDLYIQQKASPPSAADLMQGVRPEQAANMPVLVAKSYVPAGLSFSHYAATILPTVDSGEYYLNNVDVTSDIGSLYIPLSNNINLFLPNGVSTVINFLQLTGVAARAVIEGGSTRDYVYLANGSSTFVVGSQLETIVDSSGTGSSVVQARAAFGAVTVRGVNGTKATLKIVDTGSVILSAATENTRIEIGLGTTVQLTGNQNVEIVVGVPSPPLAFYVPSVETKYSNSNVPKSPTTSLQKPSQSVTNLSPNPILINAVMDAASAPLNGGMAGIVVDTIGSGTLHMHADSRNVLYRVGATSTIVLNTDNETRVEVSKTGVGTSVTLGAAGQRVTSAASQTIIVRSDARFLKNATLLNGGGVGQLAIFGGGDVVLGSNVVGMRQISLTSDTVAMPLSIALSSYQRFATVTNMVGNASIQLFDRTQSVKNAGTGRVSVFLAASSSTAFVDAGKGVATLQFTTGGTFATNVLGKSEIVITKASNVYLNQNPYLTVRVPADNIGLNAIGLASAGQQVFVENGRYSCIYVEAAKIGIGTGTTIQAGGQGQVNIYRGGAVTLGAETTGVKQIFLYKDIGGTPFRLQLSDYQKLTTVTDVVGGGRILVSESTQQITNIGTAVTTIQASSKDAGVRVNGGKAGATIEIVDDGSVVLANALHNVVVKLGLSVPVILTGSSQSLRLDAQIGGSRIEVMGRNQIIATGHGNTIVDKSGGPITMEGTLRQWDENTILNFGRDAVIHIKDMSPSSLNMVSSPNRNMTTLYLRSESVVSKIAFGGRFDAMALSVTTDFSGGAFIKLSTGVPGAW